MKDTRALVSRLAAAAVVAALVIAAVALRRSGVDAEMLQRELEALGWLAPPLFVLVFAVGELLHLPGILFVVVARVVFGPWGGFALGYVGALFALTVSFAVARRLVSAARATREPWRPKIRLLRRAFERLEAHPVRTIALLRLVLWLAPPLTYAIATTRVRARDHLIGCAIGLVIPVLVVALAGGLF
ncbi:MAG: TVP38/TMEM64 family protein [Labilithrix sp.]|nr:TVP38/TMEM64 family protein [Labilithrix sp.]